MNGLILVERQQVGFDGVPEVPGPCEGSQHRHRGLPALTVWPGVNLASHICGCISVCFGATDFCRTLSSKGEISVMGAVFFMGKDSVGWSSL